MPTAGITVLKNNAPWGPFTREQVREGLAKGDFTLLYLAHAPGLKAWLPLGEVLDHVERSTILPPVPSANAVLPELPPPVPPRVSKELVEPVTPPVLPETVVQIDPAPFVPRFLAFVIDAAILLVPVGVLFILGAILLEVRGAWDDIDHESRMQEWILLRQHLNQLLISVAGGLGWLYGAGLESSPWQATLGKRWMGLKVTDAVGRRIGFLRATGRHAAKYVSALFCFLGFIMALFSPRGLALHDRLAGTRVTRR